MTVMVCQGLVEASGMVGVIVRNEDKIAVFPWASHFGSADELIAVGLSTLNAIGYDAAQLVSVMQHLAMECAEPVKHIWMALGHEHGQDGYVQVEELIRDGEPEYRVRLIPYS